MEIVETLSQWSEFCTIKVVNSIAADHQLGRPEALIPAGSGELPRAEYVGRSRSLRFSRHRRVWEDPWSTSERWSPTMRVVEVFDD